MTIDDPFHLRIKFDQYRFCYIFDRKIELDFKNVFLVTMHRENINKIDIDDALRNILNKNLVARRLFK